MSVTPKENLMLVMQRKDPEYMPWVQDYNVAYPRGLDFVNERPEIPGVNKDWFGQSWTFVDALGAASPTPNQPLLDDVTRWKEVVKFPDLNKLDWEGNAARDTAAWDRENKFSKITIYFGLWERLNSIMMFDDALCALVEEPEACYEFFGAVADHKIRLHKKAIQHYKPDVLIMHDDYGTNDQMFMSPDVWRELIKPHLKRVVEAVRDDGVIYEHHSCGYFEPIMDDLIEIGVTSTNFMQVTNDLETVKKKHSELVVVGGFDNLLMDNPMTTEEEARASVRKTMDILAPGGGFVPFPISIGKYGDAVRDEIKTYGENFYGSRPEQYQ